MKRRNTAMTTLVRSFILLVFFALSAHAAQSGTFPLTIKGKTLTVSGASGRDTLTASLKGILKKEEPSVSTPERLQYDFIAVEGEGPVMLMFDFDKSGKWIEIRIESNLKQQNLVARTLMAWLRQNAGQGKKSGKTTTWKHEGFVYSFKEVKNAGEDSIYGITVSRK
jgi:hypothetical protein